MTSLLPMERGLAQSESQKRRFRLLRPGPISRNILRSKTISAEKLLEAKSFKNPQISKDGNWLIVEVQQFDVKTNTKHSHLFRVSVQGQQIEQLTFTGQRNHSARWSPDGQRVAFVKREGNSSQIYILSAGMTEPRKLTDLPGGAYEPRWSHSGESILFRSYVDAPCEELPCPSEPQPKFAKVQAQQHDELLFRHWGRIRDAKHSRLFTISLNASAPPQQIAVPLKEVPPVFLKSSNHYGFTHSDKVLYVGRANKSDSHPTNHDLFIFDLKTKTHRKITNNIAWDGNPIVSASQRYVAFLSQKRQGFESDQTRLKVYDSRTGKVFSLSEDYDISFEEIAWDTDEKGVFFTTHRRGYLALGYISLQKKKIEYLVEDMSVTGLTVGPNNVFYEASRLDSLPEIYRHEKTTRKRIQVTSFNQKQQQKWIFGKVQSTKVTTVHPSTHGFIVLPPGYNSYHQYPLLVLLHGGPQTAWTNQWHHRWNAQVFAAQGYIVALPNPQGSVGYGQKFSDSVRLKWGKASMDGVLAFTKQVQNRSDVRPDKACAAGASFGGYLVHYLNAHSQLFDCFIAHAGIFNLEFFWGTTDRQWFPEWEFGGPPWEARDTYNELSPSSAAERFRAPVLLLHGQKDFRVDVSQSIAAFTTLRRRGITSRLIYFPDEGHWITKPQNLVYWYDSMNLWAAKYLQ